MSNDDQDFEKRWSAFLETARHLIDDQNTVAARAVLREAMTYTDEVWGENDPHLIKPWRLVAESFWREHAPLDPNNQSEVECLERALAIARRRLPADHFEVGGLAGEVGTALVVAGRVDEGCALMLECVEIGRSNGDEENFLRYLTNIALARMELQARPAEALPFFERVALVCQRADPSSSRHAMARYQLGKCLAALERYQEALNEFELALRLLDAKRVDGKHAHVMNDIMEAIDRVAVSTRRSFR